MEKVKEFFKLNIATLGLCAVTNNHPQRDESIESLPQFKKALEILEACGWEMPKTSDSGCFSCICPNCGKECQSYEDAQKCCY